jgi:cell wall assembly regulator SMI1
MAPVKQQLARLSALWKTKRPGFEKRLRSGASAAALTKFKKALGLKVPRELLALYAWHDGAKDPQGDQLEGAFGWLPLKGVLATKKMLDTMGFEDEAIYGKYAWSKAWVPFLDTNGDTVCLDTRSGIVFVLAEEGRAVGSLVWGLARGAHHDHRSGADAHGRIG